MASLNKNFIIETITGSKIKMRKMKLSDIDNILSAKGSDFLSNMIELLNKCTIEIIEPGIYSKENFDWLDTYEGDWFSALFKLRANTYKSKYEINIKCPSCRENNLMDLDLDEMPIFNPNEKLMDVMKKGETKLKVKSELGDLTLRIPKAKHTIALENAKKLPTQKRKKKNNREDPIFNRISKAITMVDTKKPKEVTEWKKNLDADEAAYLIEIIEENSFGIDTEIWHDCDFCGSQIQIDMPFTKDFFLPTRKRRSTR